MKRRDLIRHLLNNNCVLLREGAGHSIYANVDTGKQASVPRHREVKKYLAQLVCEQLEIPPP